MIAIPDLVILSTIDIRLHVKPLSGISLFSLFTEPWVTRQSLKIDDTVYKGRDFIRTEKQESYCVVQVLGLARISALS